jgi:hypothetical protein
VGPGGRHVVGPHWDQAGDEDDGGGLEAGRLRLSGDGEDGTGPGGQHGAGRRLHASGGGGVRAVQGEGRRQATALRIRQRRGGRRRQAAAQRAAAFGAAWWLTPIRNDLSHCWACRERVRAPVSKPAHSSVSPVYSSHEYSRPTFVN